jgi:hypothetical protein
MLPRAATCSLPVESSYTRTRMPLAIAASLAESGEKRSESTLLERRTSRWEPDLSFWSTIASFCDAPARIVTNATQRPSGEIVGARPTPSRRGSLPLSRAR